MYMKCGSGVAPADFFALIEFLLDSTNREKSFSSGGKDLKESFLLPGQARLLGTWLRQSRHLKLELSSFAFCDRFLIPFFEFSSHSMWFHRPHRSHWIHLTSSLFPIVALLQMWQYSADSTWRLHGWVRRLYFAKPG